MTAVVGRTGKVAVRLPVCGVFAAFWGIVAFPGCLFKFPAVAASEYGASKAEADAKRVSGVERAVDEKVSTGSVALNSQNPVSEGEEASDVVDGQVPVPCSLAVPGKTWGVPEGTVSDDGNFASVATEHASADDISVGNTASASGNDFLSQTSTVAAQASSGNVLFLLSDLYEKFGDCCVRVSCRGADGKTQVASGFFVSDKGHVLTPVIGGEDFYVETRSHCRFSAKKCGEDPVSSLCLLQASTDDKQSSYFSLLHSSDWPKIGQPIVSLSCKLGGSVSPQIGYVTAFRERYFGTEFPFVFVRSSLRIDAGDCGGAVLDIRGNLLGMLFHALPDTQETFYMPSWGLERIFGDLLLYGNVRYGYAGLAMQTVYDSKTRAVRLRVQTVQPNSPAEQSGFGVGDVLLTVNGEEVTSAELFKNFIFLSKAGDILRCTVLRGKKTLALALRLAEKERISAPSGTERVK